MKKKKALPSFLYLVFIVLLPWGAYRRLEGYWRFEGYQRFKGL